MNNRLNRLFSLITLVLVFHAAANAQLKQEVMSQYNYRGKDSIIFIKQTKEYNTAGAIVLEEKLNYLQQGDSAVLNSKTYLKYNPAKKILETGEVNKGENTKTIKIGYRNYTGIMATSQKNWEKQYDASGEIFKEDTFRYDEKSRLIGACSYNFTGNTSKYCTKYYYNCKNKLKKEKNYIMWNTVKRAGKMVERSTLREKICYKYDKQGRLVKRQGKVYSTKYKEEYKYFPDGITYEKTYTELNRYKKDKETKERWHETRNVDQFRRGVKVASVSYKDGIEQERFETIWKDTLPSVQIFYSNNIKAREISYLYLANGKLSKSTDTHFREGKPAAERILEYNQWGDLVREEWIAGGKISEKKSYEYEYDNLNRKTKTKFFKNGVLNYTKQLQYDQNNKIKSEVDYTPEGVKASGKFSKYVYF